MAGEALTAPHLPRGGLAPLDEVRREINPWVKKNSIRSSKHKDVTGNGLERGGPCPPWGHGGHFTLQAEAEDGSRRRGQVLLPAAGCGRCAHALGKRARMGTKGFFQGTTFPKGFLSLTSCFFQSIKSQGTIYSIARLSS